MRRSVATSVRVGSAAEEGAATVQPATITPERRSLTALVAFILVLLLVVGVVAFTPLAVLSLWEEVPNKTLSREAFWLTPTETEQSGPAESYARLHVDLVKVDEIGHTITLKVAGNHICTYVDPNLPRYHCRNKDVITFYSIPADGLKQQEGRPFGAPFVLPENGDAVRGELVLPFSGNLMRYPFDEYHFRLGIVMEREMPDGRRVTLSPAEARGHLFITMDDQLPRMKVVPPIRLDPASVRPTRNELVYLHAAEIALIRPTYLKILVVLLLLLITATAAFAVLLRPFRELILNAGTSVLGVWGVRSLLLGTYPHDVTVVDMLLSSVVLFLLFTITVRAFDYLQERAKLRLLPWLPWND